VISKTPDRQAGKVRVTFVLPGDVGDDVFVCGEFNDWSRKANRMGRSNGRFVATLVLDSGARYRFRYLIDGSRWQNDPEADAYVDNSFGSEDSVVET
jgi:1,4-alpha-glucan branching enzyme